MPRSFPTLALALAAGKDRFVLLSRTITAHTLYQAGSVIPVGHVATLRFISFGAEGLPPAFAAYAPLAIPARDVMAALAPAYGVDAKVPAG
ncbi:hypothetical protein [Novosphingobium pokkalii]|uniref:Uncharacterized protein n=1 Tax=Novosphingobium pokkalii TaxID=1770194 RepID=A0ABV7V9D4_9SPHN|nr:hypothetical protein [Novosphingobium pokkalii]GHC95353.1 hypothetical protein GCM10019060_24360 [Novosphingobium pokkalii]